MGALPKLNRKLVQGGFTPPNDLRFNPAPVQLPEKVLQFGEGNFLRGFVDWMIGRLNAGGKFKGRVAVVQPIAQGLADKLNEQDGMYTVLLRGMQDGKPVDQREMVDCISRALNPYTHWQSVLELASSRDLRFVVSNTTEAGIVFRAEDKLADAPPASFPGKLTRLLLERFNSLGGENAPGLIMLPCELIERNGDNLAKAVEATAKNWSLSAEFMHWLKSANVFANTLVDRIVTGYPRDDAASICQQLGYQDDLLVAGEPFHFWVIEAPASCAAQLPLNSVGLNVVFTENMTPYRDRKVRILNGAHTMAVPAAFLTGKDTVGELMGDQTLSKFMSDGIQQEIIPTLNLPRQDLEDFAAAVRERFSNPFVKHALLSITLNSTSKFKSRVVPSIKRFAEIKGFAPRNLSISFAALIAFYRGSEFDGTSLKGNRGGATYPIQDDPDALRFFADVWHKHGSDLSQLVRQTLANTKLWGEDLNAIPGLAERVLEALTRMTTAGVAETLRAT